MRKILLAIVVTAVLTWFILGLVQGLRTAADRVWMMSAMKYPGQSAIREIQEDMEAGRYRLAKAKGRHGNNFTFWRERRMAIRCVARRLQT